MCFINTYFFLDFSYPYAVFRTFYLLFYVLDVVSITVYDRHTLLNIGSSVAQHIPDFEFLNGNALFTDTASEPFVWAARSRPREMPPEKGEDSWRPCQTETASPLTSTPNHFAG